MSCSMKGLVRSALLSACVTAGVLACGTPPMEPPQPPAPPVVCCRIVSWYVDPICPGREVLILCYFREDGLPLFVSNPMPLPFNQQCACGLAKLPPIPGVMDGGISFGPVSPAPLAESCILMPPDLPGYGPFTPLCEPNSNFQVDSFFDVFYTLASFPTDPTDPCPRPSTVFQFRGGPDAVIPPGVPFAVYRKIVIPAGLDPNLLCGSGLSSIGLFLIDSGNVLIEPPAPGLPPMTLPQFQMAGGIGAFYKVKCLPLDLPGPCPLGGAACCVGDANCDGVVDFNDITAILANWLQICIP